MIKNIALAAVILSGACFPGLLAAEEAPYAVTFYRAGSALQYEEFQVLDQALAAVHAQIGKEEIVGAILLEKSTAERCKTGKITSLLNRVFADGLAVCPKPAG